MSHAKRFEPLIRQWLLYQGRAVSLKPRSVCECGQLEPSKKLTTKEDYFDYQTFDAWEYCHLQYGVLLLLLPVAISFFFHIKIW